MANSLSYGEFAVYTKGNPGTYKGRRTEIAVLRHEF